MTETINELLQNHSNDYSMLNNLYENSIGCDLVLDPLNSYLYTPDVLTISATIIIPAWNAAQTIIQCLTAIEQSSFNRRYPDQLEVIVVDDGSIDSTWTQLSNLNIDLNLIAVQQEHYSRSHAMNTGISLASGDILISCDADMLLTPFTIEELVKRHQVLENILCIGFRYNIESTDIRLGSDKLEQLLFNSVPRFYGDNRVRFHWPGWPENMCVTWNHLKELGHNKQIWINDGELPDGDAWNLHRMVYGSLFSASRKHIEEIGGFDERFYGWGWEDSLVGAKLIALGNYVLPIYSAVGMHVAHPDRSPTKWREAERNYDLLSRVLQTNIESDKLLNERCRKRVRYKVQRFSSSTNREIPQNYYTTLQQEGKDTLSQIIYYFHLGRYRDVINSLESWQPDHAEVDQALMLRGKALCLEQHYEEAIPFLRELSQRLTEKAQPLFDLGMAFANSQQIDMALVTLKKARERDPNSLWLKYVLDMPVASHFRRGMRYFAQGDYVIALQDFTACILQEPYNIQAQRWHTTILDLLHK